MKGDFFLADMKKVIIDAGHGGYDLGASYYGRREKDDALALALEVGKILSRNGVDVLYTRVDDVYNTPYEKAEIANNSGADYFVSIHRNAMPVPNTASGSETLVYENTGIAAMLAEDINSELEKAGFNNLGVIERPGLVVLRRTEMPAVLVEAGFIDNEADNRFFDQNFDAIAQAIASGVLNTISKEEAERPEYYQVQVGAFQHEAFAKQLSNRLSEDGFQSFTIYENGYYKVRVGAYLNLDNAVIMEQKLRDYGYNTFITKGY